VNRALQAAAPGAASASQVAQSDTTSASGGANAVKWTVQTACSADAATYDTAFNAAQTITTNVAANNIQTVSSQATVTVTGCAVDNVMNFKIGRDTSDTFTGTARLIGAQVVLRHTGK